MESGNSHPQQLDKTPIQHKMHLGSKEGTHCTACWSRALLIQPYALGRGERLRRGNTALNHLNQGKNRQLGWVSITLELFGNAWEMAVMKVYII